MPRTRRVDAPGATHHVLLRGVARGLVFRDDRDRWRFLRLLERLLPEEEVQCFAWALMPNHVHLLLRSGRVPISRLMARLGTSYAQGFNGRHDRVGHLFQDRFKSILVESDVHLRWLVRYIHRNPVEGDLLAPGEPLSRYPWTGHPELMACHPPMLVRVETVLSWFGPSPESARAALARWMDSEAPDDSRSLRDVLALEADSAPDALRTLVADVCTGLGVLPDELLHGARRMPVSRARAIVVSRAHEELGLPLAAIERALGLSRGAGHRALQRARRFVSE